MIERGFTNSQFETVKFDEKTGLIVVVVQDNQNGQVLMVAYMNKIALEKTISSTYAHYWSRSKNRLWMKGETSGNIQKVKSISVDCDGDALLLLVDQKGVACHTGNKTCFFRKIKEFD